MDTTIAASCLVGTAFYNVNEINQPEQFCGLFNLPGEGFIAQVVLKWALSCMTDRVFNTSFPERKQQGLCAAAMEEALTHMNHVQEQSSLSVGSD
ncbi:MAG: hypothetical protein CM1200mP41_31110 [Gammaproteobacteria bacterium]|nr:MAG: hypothetical protein CM1200mP41_31110 [Gammaproteobacteria bacterium]